MSESKGLLQHPLFVAIFGGIASTGILAYLAYEKITVPVVFGWLSNAWAFANAETPIRRGIFWAWVVATIALVVLVVHTFVVLTEKLEQVATQKPKPASPSFQSYVTDVFFRFRWRWKVAADKQVWSISMYCPKCDLQLTDSDIEERRFREYYCTCSHCQYWAQTDAGTVEELTRPVKLGAERKLRTGEWQQSVKKSR